MLPSSHLIPINGASAVSQSEPAALASALPTQVRRTARGAAPVCRAVTCPRRKRFRPVRDRFLAWLLWLRAARAAGARPSVARARRIGAVAVPLSMAAAHAGLALTGSQ